MAARRGVNVALQSATQWGGSYSVGFNNQRGTTNNAFALFNPQLNSTFQAQYQQSLLRNFSIDQTRQRLIGRNKLQGNWQRGVFLTSLGGSI